MAETKSGFHYAWVIFICACLLGASAMALTVSILGVFLLPAATNLGVNPGDFAMWATVSGFVSVIMLPIWGQILPKHTKACFLAGSILLIVALLGFAFAPSLPVVILAGCCVGAEMPILFTFGLPTIMGQWFVGKQRGKFLGIATAFSGVGTFVWAPMFTVLIQDMGVQTAYLIAAVLVAILSLPMGILVVWDPASKGLKPIGWTEDSEGADKAAVAASATGVSASRAMKSPAFWIFLIAVCFLALGAGFNNSQPAICAEFIGGEGAAMLGASMISAGAVGNILGKIVFGIVSDKIGPKITSAVFICFSLVAMLMWMFLVGEATYVVAGFLFGTNNAVASVGFPLICRTIFGDKDYSKIWSRLCMGSALLGGFGTSFVAYIAQFTGSYGNAIWVGFVMFCVVILCALIAVNIGGKLQAEEK